MRYILFVFVSLILFSSCEKQEQKPNVVLIVADDLGWKDLGIMGSNYYETPNIDKLAQEGLLFTNAYASAANCAPSRACMLSGMNTPRHGVYTVGTSERGKSAYRKIIPTQNTLFLEDSLVILHEMFKSAGYKTSNFGKWHIGKDPSTQGVDVNKGGGKAGNPGRDGYFSPYNVPNLENGPEGEYLTTRLTNEAIEFMKESGNDPFFAYIPYYTVHTPILAPNEWKDKYREKQPSNGQGNYVYGAMVGAMDYEIGRILQFLKGSNLEKNTIVLFTSDNGGFKGITSQEPLRAGKGAYYEGGIRVPLIIKWPGVTSPGTTTEERVTNMDLYPTFKDIIKPSKYSPLLDGNDLGPVLKGGEIESRDLYWHFPVYLEASVRKNAGTRDPLYRTRPGTVVISGNWKLHHYFEDNAYELYNLDEDVGEQYNLIESELEKFEELKGKMQRWRSGINAPVPMTKNPDFDSLIHAKKLQEYLN